MNSTLSKALGAVMLGVAGAGSALAQQGVESYDPHCWGTTPYSNDFLQYYLETPLFGAGIGVSGNGNWSNVCIDPAGSVPVRGRIGFMVGPQGTIQDDIQGAPVQDNLMTLVYGMNRTFGDTSGSGWSFARIRVRDAAGATTDSLYGANGMNLAFIGSSNRYMYTESTNNNINIRCVVDVIGDTARVSWRLRNDGTAATNLGLWFGQWTVLRDQDWVVQGYTNGIGEFQPYVYIPGYKPITTQQRWQRTDVSRPFPDAVNFMIGQQFAYGLQVVNGPTPETTDQNGNSDASPVDEFVIGDVVHLLSGAQLGNANPTFNDFIFPDAGFETALAYAQKWEPTGVAVATGPNDANGSRSIVAYYRSTWGDASYSGGYTAVVDTPKVISTDVDDPTTYVIGTPSNPATIRVNIDNTGGFGIVDRTFPMDNVRVTLTLPQGLHAVGNPNQRVLTRFITRVDPVQMAFTDFQFEVDPEAFGEKRYQVTIEPNPGTVKTVTGIINVAATPRLRIFPGANLITSPWEYTDSTWEAILSGLQVDVDYQVFKWSPDLQQYIIQTQAERGIGSWIVATSDFGLRVLGGVPHQPSDGFDTTGNATPQIRLKPGWNLIANPFNYAIPVSQIIGSPTGTGLSLTWNELIPTYISGALSTYDTSLRNYVTIQGTNPSLQPNAGYWVFVEQDLTIKFPAIYQPFVRETFTPTSFRQSSHEWRLQIAAQTSTSYDGDNYVGVDTNAAEARKLVALEPPMAPAPDALRAYITDTATTRTQYSQALRNFVGKQEWALNVQNKRSGLVTLKWPNLATVPRNLRLTLVDNKTRISRDLRRVSSYSYSAIANQSRSFRIIAQPMGTAAIRVGTAQARFSGTGTNRRVSLTYLLSANARTDIRVLKNGKQVYQMLTADADTVGTNYATWDVTLGNGLRAPAGTYILDIMAEGEGGDVARRQVAVTVGN